MKLRQEIKEGVFFTFVLKYANMFVQMIGAAVLARILTPDEYGIVAVIMVIVAFFQLISNFGLGTAIIQKQNLTEDNIFSLFLFTIIIGIVLSGIFSLIGPLIAHFYHNNEYKKISIILSVVLFFHTANIVPYALIMKNKWFKTIGIIYLVIEIITTTIAIITALMGFGYYALIIKSIFNAILAFSIDSITIKLKLYGKLNFHIVRELFTYSFFQLLYNILNYISKSLDTILVGKYFGNNILGYYDRAYRLVFLPVNSISNIITPVLHPILSSHQNDHDLIYRVFKESIKFLSMIGIPISIFIFFNAKEIILIMYGNQWTKSVPIFKLLSMGIWIQILLPSIVTIFQALGKTNYLFIYGLLSTLFIVSGILTGIFLFNSIHMIVVFLLIAYIITICVAFYLLIIKLLGRNLFDVLILFRTGLYCGAAFIIFNLLFEFVTDIQNLIASLSLKLLFSGLIFIIVLNQTKELKYFINTINPKKH